MRILHFFLFVFSFVGLSAEAPKIEQAMIAGCEVYSLAPETEGPHPVLFLLHGSQVPNPSPGGKQLVNLGYLERVARQGVMAVAISMPGYGNTPGVRDYCGPESQKAISNVVEAYRSLQGIDADKMGIYGISRGAILASRIPGLSFRILEAGSYDATTRSVLLPPYLSAINTMIEREAGKSFQALKERSAVFYPEILTGDTLILHGEIDDRMGLVSAKKLHHFLREREEKSILKVFPQITHILPKEKWETIIPFLREKLVGNYGIGLKIHHSTPVHLITHVLPHASTRQVRSGDAILKISPNNDSEEIDAVDLPLPELIAHILGEKGTFCRLTVQHHGGDIEEIVMERTATF